MVIIRIQFRVYSQGGGGGDGETVDSFYKINNLYYVFLLIYKYFKM